MTNLMKRATLMRRSTVLSQFLQLVVLKIVSNGRLTLPKEPRPVWPCVFATIVTPV